MELDWTYKPRRRRRNGCIIWSGLATLLAIYLFVQRPDWLVRQQPPPLTTPTPSALFWQTEAEAHISDGNYSEAETALKRMAELEPNNAYPLVMLAELHIMARRVEQAFEFSQASVRIDDQNVAALTIHARVLDWMGRYDAAYEFAFEALDLEPDNPDTLAVLGEIYTDEGNWASAQQFLEKALALDPENVLALRNLAVFYELRGDYERAIVAINHAIEAAPVRADLYVERGRQYVLLEEWEAAIASYEQAVAIDERAYALDALGWAFWKRADYPQALRFLRRAAESEPNNPIILAHLGMAYYRRLNYESAAATLEKALADMDERDITAQYTLTLGLSHIFKKPEECHRALPWLHKTLEFAPGLSPAHQGLRRCAFNS